MSRLREPPPGRLVFSIFAGEDGLIRSVLEQMGPMWGGWERKSPPFPFPDTLHYRTEFGAPLVRRFAVARPLVGQGLLPWVKVWAQGLERRWSREGRRLVNCDPGLLTLERLVLATGKGAGHRLYLGLGVFGDLTLVYERGGFVPLRWTYPDYAGEDVRRWWEGARAALKEALRARRAAGGAR